MQDVMQYNTTSTSTRINVPNSLPTRRDRIRGNRNVTTLEMLLGPSFSHSGAHPRRKSVETMKKSDRTVTCRVQRFFYENVLVPVLYVCVCRGSLFLDSCVRAGTCTSTWHPGRFCRPSSGSAGTKRVRRAGGIIRPTRSLLGVYLYINVAI